MMAAQDKVIISDDMLVATFVELICKLDCTMANSNRDILVRDQYTNVGSETSDAECRWVD